MTTQDFQNRIIVVVRKDIESWQIANTIAHISAYIGNQLKESFGTGEYFITRDNVQFPRNSQYPIIIKSANTSEELKDLLREIRTHNLVNLGFIREMIDHTDDTELQLALAAKIEDAVELLGVGVFGSNEELKTLTKKFQLWK